ncbi:MAG TPA: fumarate/nitrate reduction transcriptional regulator Fnr [Gammaproteobacteria bacterium]|nr:fumarate/nitrate reduction transcriptional regulator Fnr [Gammaproteobacteria bacterium]
MPVEQGVVKLTTIRQACSDCSLFQLCLPVALDTSDVELLDDIVQRRRPLRRGDYLYRTQDPFRAIYAVRAGALKTSVLSYSGEEQITGFHLPGEILGLDAINDNHHPCSAMALETTSVCEIPFEHLEHLALKIPGLQQSLLRIMSKEIFKEQELLHAVAKRSAEERLAIALLSFSQRFGRRGLSKTRFRLPMSRADLSNYLGLAPETMSRLFRRFQEQGLLLAEGKEVTLTEKAALLDLAHARGCIGAENQAGAARKA